MDIDILKVVNDFLEKKDSTNSIDRDSDKERNENSIITTETSDKKEYLSTKELESIIYELFSNGGNLNLLSELSEKYLINQDNLIHALNEKGYQKIWANKEVTYYPNTDENTRILKIVSELNSGKSLDIVSRDNGISRESLLEIMRNKGFIQYWIKVTNKYEFNIICKLGNMSILRNAKSGVFKYIIYKDSLTLTIKQTNFLLGINSFYYSSINETKNKFIENIHYFRLNKEQIYHVINSDPALTFLMHTPYLFTLKGIELLLEVSGKGNNYNNEYAVFLNKQGFVLDSILRINALINSSELEKIVYELNNGKNFEEISLEININKEMLESELTKANYLYHKDIELWSICNIEKFINEVLSELNNGMGIYDIAGKYVTEKNRRLRVVTNLQNKLEQLGYKFNKQTRKWDNQKIGNDKETYENDIDYFVTELNKGKLFNELESATGLNRTLIRMKLRKAGISLDYKTNKWTKKENGRSTQEVNDSEIQVLHKKENQLDPNNVQQIIDALNKGMSFSTLEAITKLNKQEINNKFKTERVYFDFGDNIWKIKEESEKSITPVTTETEKVDGIDNEVKETSLSSDEISILKEIIKDFTVNKSKGKNEFKVIINDDVYNQLNYYTEIFETSKSLLIEKALNEYFEKQKPS
jgi:hypothetical protein